MEPAKLGLIGFGEIGRAHSDALAGISEADLVAVADPSEHARKQAESLGVKTFSTHAELLSEASIDGVIIATPDELHLEPSLDAAQAGKHILVEKPIGATVQDGQKIKEAAEKAGIKLMVGHTLRFFPEYNYAKTQVAAGELGQLVSVFARRTNVISQPKRIAGRISVLGFLGVHDFDALRWIIDSEPTRIYCENATSVTHGFGVEDETFTTIRFANGVIACLHCGWFVPDNHPSGFDFRLDVTGDQGIVNLDFANSVTVKHNATGTRQPLISTALAEECRPFATSILNDTAVPVSADDGIAAVKMACAAEQSVRTGLPIDLC